MSSILALSLLLSAAQAPQEHRYFVIVGNNESVEKDVAPLQFADNDAAKFYELFALYAHKIALLTVLDAESQQIFKDAAAAAKAPKVAELLQALGLFYQAIAKDNKAGIRTVLYFVYSGHGQKGKDGEGYVNYLDGKFKRSDLYREILAKSPASINHIIIDACHAYLMVAKKGAYPDDKVKADLGGALSALMSVEDLSKYPNTGVILSTTANAEAHEWATFGGGIFSHELRSGLTGTADVNSDGKITYDELLAYIEAANREVKDPKAKIQIFARAPAINPSETLINIKESKAGFFLRFKQQDGGRFYLEDSRGVRYADFNKSVEQPMEIALVPAQRYFLRTETGEAGFDLKGKTIELGSLKMTRKIIAAKGSIEDDYRKYLYAVPFGIGFYKGVTALSQRAAVPAELKPKMPGVEPGIKIAMPEMKASGVASSLAYNLTQIMATEISNTGKYKIMTDDDIKALLDEEQKKQLLKCDDVSCMVEIGGALGAHKIVAGNVGKVGDTYVLGLRLIDVAKVDVEKRLSETIKAREEYLIDTAKVAITKLLGEERKTLSSARLAITANEEGARITLDDIPLGVTPLAVRPEVDAGKHKILVEKDGFEKLFQEISVAVGETKDLMITLKQLPGKPASLKPWAWASIAVAGLAAGGGWIAGHDAEISYKGYRNADSRETAETLRDRTGQSAIYANVFFGTAALAAVASVVLFALDPGSAEDAGGPGVKPVNTGRATGIEIDF